VAAPRPVVTIGLHGSASTWVYNVAREVLAAAFGDASVTTCFVNTSADLPDETTLRGRHLVCKTHGWPELPAFSRATNAAILLSVRDPRDAVVSLMRRFASPYEVCVRGVALDCQYAAWCAASGHPMLRYEDRFFDNFSTVTTLARHLAAPVSDAAAARIFATYATDAVRAFADAVPSLPPERLAGDGKTLVFDNVTQIHRTHIGDGRVGKWRDHLTAPRQAALTRHFAPFLDRFGYKAG
jgi:hypothetical protein